MTTLGEMKLEDAAKDAAGNRRKFDSFSWFRERDLELPEDWAIFYTQNRDSGILARSNAGAIAESLKPFTETGDPDIVFESHAHWAVGHVDGFSIRVFKNGEITDAFKAYHELVERLADDPVLDEEDHSRREYEATIENIAEAAWRLKREYDLPDDWESAVLGWLRDHNPCAVENRDDQGGYPEENDLRTAFEALEYPRLE